MIRNVIQFAIFQKNSKSKQVYKNPKKIANLAFEGEIT